MEALLAVGLAGNVAQFVQFSAKVISIANEIRKQEHPSSVQELKDLSVALTQQARVIISRLKANKATLEQEEQYLLDVAAECEAASESFISYLDGLIARDGTSNVMIRMKTNIKFQWNQHKVESYISKLEKLQSSLTLATTLALRSSSLGNDQEILAHLKLLENGEQYSQEKSDELLVILKQVNRVVDKQSGPKLDSIQDQVTRCLESITALRKDITRVRETDILQWLDFRQKTWRYNEVDPAYERTFAWIFRKPTTDSPASWHDFVGHLSSTNTSSPYFINGKAGSGKSTLMKFLISHQQTTTELQKWAGDYKMLVLNFFFWNVGTDLQKSHTGMLRSILHSILVQHPELIPVIFPQLYCSQEPLPATDGPCYVELKTAFELLKERSAPFLRLCLFIDGVDEFEGDQRDMSQFLCSLASPHVRLVVSSRPTNACLKSFERCPTLRLQDLTRSDMDTFIHGELYSHPMMVGLKEETPTEAKRLIKGIGEKAEGVFLWVRLVTRLLVRGLEDGDDIGDLLVKLRTLPSDLLALYRRMMERMEPEHLIQAAQIFQIHELWRAGPSPFPLESITLAFAVNSPLSNLKLPVAYMKKDEKKRLIERIEARVRSRCCGLLEIRTMLGTLAGTSTNTVTYLHRTVGEFFSLENVWDELRLLTEGTSFNPASHIVFGIMSLIRIGHSCERDVFLAETMCNFALNLDDDMVKRFIMGIDKTITASSTIPEWIACVENPYNFSCRTFVPLHANWARGSE